LNGFAGHRLRFEKLFQIAQMVNGVFAETFDEFFQMTKLAFQFVELFVMNLFYLIHLEKLLSCLSKRKQRNAILPICHLIEEHLRVSC